MEQAVEVCNVAPRQADRLNSCYWCPTKGICLAHGEAPPAACVGFDVPIPPACPACQVIATWYGPTRMTMMMLLL